MNSKSEVEKPVHSQLARVRNDSDIQLEGVLLDGEGSHTSPEGSNWSLNSCSSFQSNRSVENPPTYFQVIEESWDDCNSAQHGTASSHTHTTHCHLQTRNVQSSPSPITPANLCSPLVKASKNCATSTNAGANSACSEIKISNTNGNTRNVFIAKDVTGILLQPTPFCDPDLLTSAISSNGETTIVGAVTAHNGNGIDTGTLGTESISHPLSPSFCSPSEIPGNSNFSFVSNGVNGNKVHGRTSPVAVPKSNNNPSSQTYSNHRPESNSSASIGRLVLFKVFASICQVDVI